MKNQKIILIASFLGLLLFSYTAKAQIFMTITGKKQGDFFKPEKGLGLGIPLTGYSLEDETPIDAATGKVSGKIHHSGITITKRVDGTSPKFFIGMNLQESLDVKLEFTKNTGAGKVVVFQTVILKNASISKIVSASGNLIPSYFPGLTGSSSNDNFEMIRFSYEEIEIQNTETHLIYSGSWMGN